MRDPTPEGPLAMAWRWVDVSTAVDYDQSIGAVRPRLRDRVTGEEIVIEPQRFGRPRRRRRNRMGSGI